MTFCVGASCVNRDASAGLLAMYSSTSFGSMCNALYAASPSFFLQINAAFFSAFLDILAPVSLGG